MEIREREREERFCKERETLKETASILYTSITLAGLLYHKQGVNSSKSSKHQIPHKEYPKKPRAAKEKKTRRIREIFDPIATITMNTT